MTNDCSGSVRASFSAAPICQLPSMPLARMSEKLSCSAPDWPTYAWEQDPYLQLDTPISTGSLFRDGKCNFWDRLGYY